jgi:hypothetical protein
MIAPFYVLSFGFGEVEANLSLFDRQVLLRNDILMVEFFFQNYKI